MNEVKVLILDDDFAIGALLGHYLKDAGCIVHFQTSIMGLEEVAATFAPDVVVLDVELGDVNGIDALPAIKSFLGDTPIIFISSHNKKEYRVSSIRRGGEVFLQKPFEPEELLAYIEKFVTERVESTEVLNFGGWSLNAENNTLTYRNNAPNRLTQSEFKILRLLVRNKNRVVLRAEILGELYGKDITEDKNLSINNFVLSLRKHFSVDKRTTIKTVHGIGYRLYYSKFLNNR